MGRKLRVEEEGGIYYVDNTDKDYLAGLFGLIGESGECKIYGFVIMGNHYHLVLRTVEKPLQSIMHRLNMGYSKYFNRKHERSGHVFQGRYKAIPVRDERYTLSLL